VTRIDASYFEMGVSCPSITLCVAVSGQVFTSTNPIGGQDLLLGKRVPAAWIATDMDASPEFISCPTTSFCVAMDFNGVAATSSNPTGGPPSWRATQIKGAGRVYGVSCASASLCVAVEGEAAGSDSPVDLNGPSSGNVVTSSNPSIGDWTVTNVDGPHFLHGVSCPSLKLCVAVDNIGNVITSRNPTGGKSAWRVTNVDARNSLSGVSCPTSTFCVAVDNVGNVITSSNPTGGKADWKVTKVDGRNYLYGVSCPSTTFCVAIDGIGNVIIGSGQP
jgi:hypothetical protein